MTAARSRNYLCAAALGILLYGPTPALSQLDSGFMPKGGKTLLLELLGSPPNTTDLRQIVESRRSEAEWRAALDARAKTMNKIMSERELRTLAAYLALNMPVPDPDGVVTKAAKPAELAPALPRDGRELAWNECQYCHSLFSSHLTQERSVQAWLNMFQSPFHREMKMTAKEREEFAHYSTINMPMKIEDVPPDLRF
ncbi:MAG: hypothetical protein ACK4UO_04810 [Pseudolabrys sp.]